MCNMKKFKEKANIDTLTKSELIERFSTASFPSRVDRSSIGGFISTKDGFNYTDDELQEIYEWMKRNNISF